MPESSLGRLTSREREVMDLIADGQSNAAICRRLHLHAKTVESHVRSLFGKLGVEQREDENRRVKAVVVYNRFRAQSTHTTRRVVERGRLTAI